MQRYTFLVSMFDCILSCRIVLEVSGAVVVSRLVTVLRDNANQLPLQIDSESVSVGK